jgi:hypothetical protein
MRTLAWKKQVIAAKVEARFIAMMRLYQCPACDCLPVRYKKKPKNPPHCVRCGRQLIKLSRFSTGYRWVVGLAAAGAAILFAPHVLESMADSHRENAIIMGLTGRLAPEEAMERMVESIDSNDLLAKLEEADLQWHPREELLPNGSVRYVYKRRAGEPDLSVSELRSLVDSPPSFDEERIQILALMSTLREKGVRVLLTPTTKKGAAAEWDHRRGVLRIQPEMADKGSLDFLRVLNHEAIHVAQSCKGGSVRAKPKALGMKINNPEKLESIFKDPVYLNSSNWEKGLELEAYHMQNDREKASQLLEDLCKTA